MVFSVKTFNNINQIGLKELGNAFQIDGDKSDNPDAYILRSQNLHGQEFPSKLKAIARAGAGFGFSSTSLESGLTFSSSCSCSPDFASWAASCAFFSIALFRWVIKRKMKPSRQRQERTATIIVTIFLLKTFLLAFVL